MSKNLNDPGRPSEMSTSHRQAAAVPYVAWTSDVHTWMDEGLCIGWHPGPQHKHLSEDSRPRRALEWVDLPPDTAKKICNGSDGVPACPVRGECLQRALNMRPLPHHGVWGGRTDGELRRLLPLTVVKVAAA